MITQDTAAKIWNCHRDIAAGETLLQDLDAAAKDREHDRTSRRIKDAFGTPRNLQLGVPSGADCHRLIDVSPNLAASIIRAHIAEKQAELVSLNEQARLELDACA